MNIDYFVRSVQIGAELTLHLRTGASIQGQLTDIDADAGAITVVTGKGTASFLVEMIGAFEVSPAPGQARPQADDDGRPVATPHSPAAPEPADRPEPRPNGQASRAPAPVVSLEIIKRRARIEAFYAAAVANATLKVQPVSLKFRPPGNPALSSADRMTIKKEFDRVWNQYQYAHRINELSRLNASIQTLRLIGQDYPPIPQVQYNIGCLQLELGRHDEAIEHFRAAAQAAAPEALINLANAAQRLNKPDDALEALRQLFITDPHPTSRPSPWHVLLDLVIRLRAPAALAPVLDKAATVDEPEDARTIVESAFFVVSSLGERTADQAATLLDTACLARDALTKLAAALRALQHEIIEGTSADPGARVWREPIQDQSEAHRRVNEHLRLAERNFQRGDLPHAVTEARNAQKLAPHDKRIAERVEAYVEAQRTASVPSGSTLYDRAQRAERERDLPKAERLYREALTVNENAEKAVKALAWLLQRQQKSAEALVLLREFEPRVQNHQAFDNMYAEISRAAGEYGEAIERLRRVLERADKRKRPIVMRRIAFAQFKAGEYGAAEDTLTRLLEIHPVDAIARRWLDELQSAKETGVYTEIDAMLVASELTTAQQAGVSDLLSYHLDHCEYAGVESAKVANHSFTEKDVDRLVELTVRQIGARRARERALFNLSAARILLDMDKVFDDRLPEFLAYFCAAMGDASVAEKKPLDVARTYYAEAMIVRPDWNKVVKTKLSQFVMSYYAVKSPEEMLAKDLPHFGASLEKALTVKQLHRQLIIGLLLIASSSGFAARELINRTYNNKSLQQAMYQLCGDYLNEALPAEISQQNYAQAWSRASQLAEKRAQEIFNELAFLAARVSDLSPPEQVERIQALTTKEVFGLDLRRLQATADVLALVREYAAQPTYLERERLASIIDKTLSDRIEEIEDGPTKISFEWLRPYLLRLRETVRQGFASLQQAAEPDDLTVDLAIDSYFPDENGKVMVQLAVSNKPDKSPASSVTIDILDSPTREYRVDQSKIMISEALGANDSAWSTLPVVVEERARQAQVFTLYYRLSFRTRAGRTIERDEGKLSIKLYDSSDFEDIPNPYAPWAEGATVEDKEMFKGRGPLIKNLVEAIQGAGSKSIVIYGQKRAGKSSILFHLEKALALPIVPIPFSLNDIVDDLSKQASTATLYYRIAQAIEDAFESLTAAGHEQVEIELPSLGQMRDSPQLVFNDFMRNLRRTLDRSTDYRDARLVLLIDEFTHIYGAIVRGSLSENFMKAWKGMLERGYFGSIIAGQDVMQEFINRFPNEFQVAQRERVSYLDPEDARALIVDPIRIPGTGKSRYAGTSVDRVLELTAGSPYYIQIFCNRLLQYMNRDDKRLILVGPADIEAVKDEMLTGRNAVGQAMFDNLLTPGDVAVSAFPAETVISVLSACAVGRGSYMYLDATPDRVQSVPDVHRVFEDLARRDVIKPLGGSRYRILVGLFAEWLQSIRAGTTH